MKKSIKELFAELEGEPAPERNEREKKPAASAAERIGRALLEKLGDTSGIPEDKLAEAIIAAWDDARLPEADEAKSDEPSGDELVSAAEALEAAEGGKRRSPFPSAPARTPVPIKSGAVNSAPIDYEGLTDKQFRQLKKQLQRAAAEGKKVRL